MVAAAALANLLMWAGAVAAIIDQAGTDALVAAAITGFFGLLNTALQTRILHQAQRNAELTRGVHREVGSARETAREGVTVLREATGTEKRKRKKDRRGDRAGGRRRDDRR